MNIAIYARVSTEEQAKHGYSLEHQLTTCKEQAYKDNTDEYILFTEYIDDGFSGEFIERPLLSKLREDVHSAFIEKVYCYDPDRLSRTLMHQLILDEELNKKSKLIFVNGEYEKTPEGKLFYQLRGAVAEFEKAKINERMSNGRKTKGKKGMVIKNSYIYGYDYDKENGKLVVNENEANIVHFIYDSFTGKNGKMQGINGIANYLAQSAIPTKKGKVWHRQVVRQILMNTTYTGTFAQNKWNTEGILANKFKKENLVKATIRPEEDWIVVPCPTIIDKIQFDYAQKLLETSRRRWAGRSKHEYLLSGLVRCNNCDNTMTGRRSKNWGKYIFEYSDIKNTAGTGTKNPGCGTKVCCDKLDEHVWNKVLELLDKFKKSGSIDEENNFVSYETNEMNRLSKLLDEKEKARKQFIKKISQGKIVGLSTEEVNEELLESQKEIQDIKNNLEKISKQVELKRFEQGKENLMEESLQYYLSISPDEFTFEDKKNLIRFLIREIRIDRENDKIRIFRL